MKKDQKMTFGMALIPLVVMIVTMMIAVIYLEQGPHIPLIIGTITAALVAWKAGYNWKHIEESMYKGIKLAFTCSHNYYVSWFSHRLLAWWRYCRDNDLLWIKDHHPIFVPRLYYDYMCNRFFIYWQLLVDNGNDWCSGNGHRHEYGHPSSDDSWCDYFRLLLW